MIAEDEQFEDLLKFVRATRGFDFTGYKRSTLRRRVQRRLDQVAVDDSPGYAAYLEAHPEEFQLLFNTILINVTAFFRDPAAWQYLAEEAMPRMLAARGDGPIRVWSAGCASGEEAYTAAIMLAELLGRDQFLSRVKIYATDADDDALAKARTGYSAKEVTSLPAELLDRYFEARGADFTFRADLRSALIFGRHDLVRDAPISRLDLLICRNTLMYFTSETQSGVLERLHYALGDSGLLFLGKAEMLLTHGDLFKPENLKHRIFRKVERRQAGGRIMQIAHAPERPSPVSRQTLLRDLAGDASPLAQITVDAGGLMVAANDEARRLFGLGPGDAGRPLRDLEISYRPLELRSRIEEAVSRREMVAATGVEALDRDGRPRLLDVRVTPLFDGQGELAGTSVSFTDVTRYTDLKRDLDRSRQDLETAYEEIQSANEELQTTNEELQSTVEELETTNEELQSSNEELETMNEELESTNTELQTTNSFLHQSSTELDLVRHFTDSVLTSLRLAVVALDSNLAVRMWNARAEDMWGLRAGEVVGQPFFGLDIGLPVAELRPAVRALVSGRSPHREIDVQANNRRGHPMRCRVVITPVLGADGDRGVALLMEEVAG